MVTRKKAKRAVKAGAPGFDVIESAQHIWLAGLGALSRAQHEGPKLFKALVAEGGKVQDRTSKTVERAIKSALENVQSAVGDRVSDARDRAQDTWDNVEKIFQSRVQKAIHQLGVPSSHEIKALTHKVEELTKSVEKLGAMKAGRPVARTKPVTPKLGQSSAGAPIS